MNFVLLAFLFAGGVFGGIYWLMEVGRRIGSRHLARDPEGARVGVGAIEGAVFGLMGLLLAFTFSSAASRFDDRRRLVAQEANAIGTAWLRLDVLPASDQTALRELFRRYLDSRLETHRRFENMAAVKAGLARSQTLQGEIWKRAVAAARASDSQPAAALVLSALNEMIDITTTRTMATKIHPPIVIFGMLGAVALASALLAGYGMAGSKTRSRIHTVGFAAVLAVAVYVIVDLEYPRLGLIRVDAADQVLVELRRGMGGIQR